MTRRSVAILIPLLLLASTGAGAAERDAVLVRVVESDLNSLVTDWFAGIGGRHQSGHAERAGHRVGDLSYVGRFGQPHLELSGDGRMRFHVDMERARVEIGRMNGGWAALGTRCRDAVVELGGENPVGIGLDFELAIEGGVPHFIPVAVQLSNLGRDEVRVFPPDECRCFLPRWMVWGLARPRIARRVERLDAWLLSRAQHAAARLADGEPIARRLTIEPLGSADPTDVILRARRALATDGALVVAFDAHGAIDGVDRVDADTSPAWAAVPTEGSFVAVDEAFLNAVLRARFPAGAQRTAEPSGGFGKLARSDAAFVLVPGLRDFEDRPELTATIRFTTSPTLAFREAPPGGRPFVRLELAGFEVELRDASLAASGETAPALGTLAIESAVIEFAPYVGSLGGVSFELMTNEWQLASRGIEFNEAALAATLQELVFGEAFETRYLPLLREGIAMGAGRLSPRGVRVTDGFLVIDLGSLPAEFQAKR